MLTTVARFHDPIQAHIACGRLCAEGVQAHVVDDQLAMANWELRLTVGGIRIQVHTDDATRARQVLDALEAGRYALEPDPLPEAAMQAPDRESWSSRVAWAALMLLGIPLPWRRRSDPAAGTDQVKRPL